MYFNVPTVPHANASRFLRRTAGLVAKLSSSQHFWNSDCGGLLRHLWPQQQPEDHVARHHLWMKSRAAYLRSGTLRLGRPYRHRRRPCDPCYPTKRAPRFWTPYLGRYRQRLFCCRCERCRLRSSRSNYWLDSSYPYFCMPQHQYRHRHRQRLAERHGWAIEQWQLDAAAAADCSAVRSCTPDDPIQSGAH